MEGRRLVLDPGAGGLKRKSNNSARCVHFGCLLLCPFFSETMFLSELLSYHCSSPKPQLQTLVQRRACSSRERDTMGGLNDGARASSSLILALFTGLLLFPLALLCY